MVGYASSLLPAFESGAWPAGAGPREARERHSATSPPMILLCPGFWARFDLARKLRPFSQMPARKTGPQFTDTLKQAHPVVWMPAAGAVQSSQRVAAGGADAGASVTNDPAGGGVAEVATE